MDCVNISIRSAHSRIATFWFSAAVAIGLSLSLTGFAGKECQTVPLSLKLSVDKQIYQRDDTVRVTAVLTNSTDSPVWVDKDFGFGAAPGLFKLSIWNGSGRAVTADPIFVDVLPPDFAKMNLGEWVRRMKLRLEPGAFVGTTITLGNIGFHSLTPAKYRLQASYAAIDLREFGISEKRMIDLSHQVHDPVWCGESHSNDVWIEVN